MKKAIIGIIVAAVLLVIVGLVVVDLKYEALRSSPVTSHASVAGERDTLRVVLHPMLAKELIAEQIPEDKNVPGWALDRALPREVAALMTPDLQSGRVGVTLFVNEQRLGPVLAEQSTTTNLSGSIPYISWDTQGLVHERRGALTMKGSAPIGTAIREAVEGKWGIVEALTPIPIEGGHLLEAILDNRDGGAFAAILALDTVSNRSIPGNPKELANHVYSINTLRITADLAPPDPGDPDSEEAIAIKLHIEGNPRADENTVATLGFMLDMLRGQIAAGLKNSYGAELTGKTERDGLAIVSDMRLTKFDKLIGQIGGTS